MRKLLWISLIITIILVMTGYLLFSTNSSFVVDDSNIVPPLIKVNYGRISLKTSTTEPCILEDILLYSSPKSSEIIYIIEKTEDLCEFEGLNVYIIDIKENYY